MSERLKSEPKNYSSQEVIDRLKSVLTHVKDELAGLFKSELVGDWYHWFLRVDLDDSDPYKAIVAHEVEGKLSYTFESLRLGNDGEILYRGCTIDDDHPQLYLELVSEAQFQHDWAKRRQERQAEIQQKAQLSLDALKRLREEHPKHARGISVHSQKDCTFSLTLTGLSEERLRDVIKISELGVVCLDPGPKEE
jgi:hypothetical protein